MQLSDSFTVQAPVDEVWQFLLDLEQVGTCVPGVQSLEQVDEETYKGKLGIKVGPISAAFDGTARLTEVDAPRRLVAELEGDDRASASAVKATFTAHLEEVEAGVRVAYDVDVNLRGRLAQFGLAVVRGTAKKMTAQFARCMQDKLSEKTAS